MTPVPLLVGMGSTADQPGGLNRFLESLHGALRAGGLPARTLVSRPGPPLALRLLRTARSARRLAPGTDVVDVHFPLYAWWPVTRGALRRIPLVVHLQGPWAQESAANGVGGRLAHLVKEAVQRDVTRRAAAVVVLAEAGRAEAVRLGAHPARVEVVPPGVDRSRFAPGRADRRALGLPPDAPVVLTVRRLVPRTGVDVAIRAVALLPGVHLAVVGDGPERPALAALTARLGVGDRVGSRARWPTWTCPAGTAPPP